MYKSLEPYAKLVYFLSAALGDNCEIALHDLTSKDQEIVQQEKLVRSYQIYHYII